MSLKKVTLKNFRTCHDVELNDLEHLTVLIGWNGVGKTTILQGIEWMAQTASASNSVQTAPLSNELFSISRQNFFGQLVFSLNGISYRYTLELLFSNNGTGLINSVMQTELQEQLERQNDSGIWQKVLGRTGQRIFGTNGDRLAEIGQTMPMLPALAAMMPSGDTKEEILPVLAYLRGVKYYLLDEVTAPSSYKFVSDSDYKKWIEQSEDSINQDSSVVMRLLHMYNDRRNDFDELKELLFIEGLGILGSIEIKSIVINNEPYYFVDFQPGNGWEVERLPSVLFDKLSAGTRRILRILVSFFYDRNSLYLFEQPEDAIHPGLLRKLIGLLRSYDDRGQLIMASHSSDLFDVLKPEEVRLVTMQGGATRVRGLTEPELASAKRFINEEGNLSDYLDLLETD